MTTRFLESLLGSNGAGGPPLRVGVMVDSSHVYRIFAEQIASLLRATYVDVVCVVRHAPAAKCEPSATSSRSPLRWLRSPMRRRIAYALYVKWDTGALPEGHNPLDTVDVSALLEPLPSLSITPEQKGSRQYFPEESISDLRERNLDVLVRFGFGILDGEVLTVPKYGIWSFHHGDSSRLRGTPPGLWELIERHPHSGAVLQRLSPKLDGGQILARGSYPTVSGLSAARNRLAPYWGTSELLLVALWRLQRGTCKSAKLQVLPSPEYTGKQPVYRIPGNRTMSSWLMSSLWSGLSRRLTRRSPQDQEYQVALRRHGGESSENTIQRPSAFSLVPNPVGHFLADPCIVFRDGQHWLFYEDYDWSRRLGSVCVAAIEPDGSIRDARVVLSTPYHLSFPHVFALGDDMFMIPETKGREQIVLFRARRFPDEWVEEAVLLDQAAVDTCVHQQDGHWFMFTSVVESRSQACAHVLLQSTTLTSGWSLHPAAVLSTELNGIRSAGPLFRDAGRLIRPVQGVVHGYGTGLELREVTALTSDQFSERSLAQLPIQQGYAGGHSYTRAGEWEAIDQTWFRPRHRPAR